MIDCSIVKFTDFKKINYLTDYGSFVYERIALKNIYKINKFHNEIKIFLWKLSEN